MKSTLNAKTGSFSEHTLLAGFMMETELNGVYRDFLTTCYQIDYLW